MIKKMNILTKLHQEFVVEHMKTIDWDKGSTNPLIVELDPTAVCDLACPGCISEDIIATNNSFSNERLMNLAREFKKSGVKGVILIGGGEPLAHPMIGEMINYFGQNDIAVGITTNGTYIHKHLEPIANYSHWTRISVDAATKETFDILRPKKNGGSKFDLVIENIKQLSKIKKGKLGFSFLIRSEIEGDGIVSNVGEIYQAAKLAKDLGCDYFEIKPSYNYKNNAIHSLVKYDDKMIANIKEELNKLDKLIDNNFSVIKAITLDESLDGVKRKQTKTYTFCPVAELRTLVTPLGVYVCPYWRGKERFKLGDVKTTDFKTLWNSEKKQSVSSWVDPSVHCANLHCLRHESNLEVLQMIEDIKNNQDIEIVKEYDRFI